MLYSYESLVYIKVEFEWSPISRFQTTTYVLVANFLSLRIECYDFQTALCASAVIWEYRIWKIHQLWLSNWSEGNWTDWRIVFNNCLRFECDRILCSCSLGRYCKRKLNWNYLKIFWYSNSNGIVPDPSPGGREPPHLSGIFKTYTEITWTIT